LTYTWKVWFISHFVEEFIQILFIY
jgi:hypothetical protein